jgi:hypothetical protein
MVFNRTTFLEADESENLRFKLSTVSKMNFPCHPLKLVRYQRSCQGEPMFCALCVATLCLTWVGMATHKASSESDMKSNTLTQNVSSMG